ncbi:hypothetical protein SAMN04487785_11333 [Dyella jiangningensis]|nr:hypothetical protein BDW41_102604 [Dyella sp. AtDHG13]SDK94984.1 hypothetical protein SAMN04487785_11333 [Dyella jiangningensis]
METYAIVESGVVVNTVLWDGGNEWSPPSGSEAILLPDGSPVGVGYTYNGTQFTPPSAG